MKLRYPILILLAIAGILVAVFAQSGGYTPGEFQSTNPNYPKPNPFYFEGKIDWNLLGITTAAECLGVPATRDAFPGRHGRHS